MLKTVRLFTFANLGLSGVLANWTSLSTTTSLAHGALMEIHTITCPHCEGTGTCRSDNGHSCGTCLKPAKVSKDIKVVRCDVCDGFGKAEPKTARLMGRMPFLIVLVVLGVFYFSKK